ncbi:class I SAM-dependent DNA methyltransferase [Streptomyces sp. WI03-5b]|uniref:type I restriction-modification system subunit M n=1 Tax=Streptomyces sp. WI03-5b TaxID=462946 RepID=UPI0029A7B0DD|nr:class I SAM-dependent DNA methyltransferase [Streptomyces sp. WI03-5b]MDX2621427.1 class I SAM-dependent DNA methyltransferase [Streptomyces sp. WI03-5b]
MSRSVSGVRSRAGERYQQRESYVVKLTLTQLERHLLAAADILRGTMDTAEYRDFILVLFFLKRANDEFEAVREMIFTEETAAGATPDQAEAVAAHPGSYVARRVVYVPEEARWERLAGAVEEIATSYLHPALYKLEVYNDRLRGLFDHIDFNRIGGGTGSAASAKVGDKRLAQLIGHFGSMRLCGEAFEFADVIGAAYEYLLRDFADSAGIKGGEFYTPRTVVRMMVELARPQEGQRIYDPCAGTGGMLVHAKEYIDELGGDSDDVLLAGQDANSGSWAVATMNMLFHGATHFDLKIGDTLTDPAHLDTDFDLVISNPPFSMDYAKDEVAHPTVRMPFGAAPERGKADLMFLQHMLYQVEERGGSVFSVMPHGVLFRSGAEGVIRTALLDHDRVEAVIGLAPNLLSGTGIPACVVVLRARGGRPAHQRGHVLFINADREFHAGRSQNVLLPEHVEKIVSTFHRFREETNFTGVHGFARVVSREELAANDDNLNVRRYVDNAPLPEPQDVRAHLEGRVPRAEIEGKKELLEAYDIGVSDLFVEGGGDADYVDFLSEERRPDAARLTQLARDREEVLWAAFKRWWVVEAERIAALAPPAGGDDRTDRDRRRQFARLRRELIDSFRDRLLQVGLLDEYALAGAIAAWWQDARNELKALSMGGFGIVVDGWVDDVETLLAPESNPRTGGIRNRSAAERRQAYGHKVVAVIAPDFLHELAAADEHRSRLDAKLKAAQEAAATLEEARLAANTGEDSVGHLYPEVTESLLNRSELTKLRRDRKAASDIVKQLESDFWRPSGCASQEAPRLTRVRRALASEEDGERRLVLTILRDDLAARLESHLTRRRQKLAEAYRTWEDKYSVSLREVEAERERSTQRLDMFLAELGYVR